MKEVIRISTDTFRKKLSYYMNKVIYGNTEVIVQRRKDSIVKLISIKEDSSKDE